MAAGAVAAKLLESLGVKVRAYTPLHRAGCAFSIRRGWIWRSGIKNRLYMPDAQAALRQRAYLETLMAEKDSSGGVVECVIEGMPVGIGEPVFEKLDAIWQRPYSPSAR